MMTRYNEVMILGVDEVGRGPWAGPLVVGAVVLPDGVALEGLNDSKKLTSKKRVALDALIREQALGWGLGWVHAEELDELGLSNALRVATIRAVEAVKTPYHEIIIDGTINFLSETTKGRYVTTLPKADALIPAVSAASIIAKVARDTYMEQQGALYPEYGFASHVGYGTAKHLAALQTHGVTVLHRRSFAPIAKLLDTKMDGTATHGDGVSTKLLGDKAEQVVSEWLEKQGFAVKARNWKTKFCEIDIVAEKSDTRYFIEVKYRSSKNQGGGIAAITPKKVQQMRFAAELFNAQHAYAGSATLAAIAVGTNNEPFELILVE